MTTQARILGTLAARRLPDEDIFARTLRGDPVAFSEVYRRYQKRVYGFCLARSLDPGAAADASQEVFMRLLRAEPGSIENPRAWLFTVARNIVIDVIRRRDRTAEDAGVEEGELAWDRLRSADTADEVLSRSDARNVFLALRSLNPRYRTALVMRTIHGQSAKELADALETTPGAIDTLVSRARDAFGKAYASVVDLPTACRANVELIYRRHGTGITAQEQVSLDAHVACCDACKAEAKKADNPRHLAALLPFLVPARRHGYGLLERAALTLRTVPDAAIQHGGAVLSQPSSWNLATRVAAGALTAALVAAPVVAVTTRHVEAVVPPSVTVPQAWGTPSSGGWICGDSWSPLWHDAGDAGSGATGPATCADASNEAQMPDHAPGGTATGDFANHWPSMDPAGAGTADTMHESGTVSQHSGTTSHQSTTGMRSPSPTREAPAVKTEVHSDTGGSWTSPMGHDSGPSGAGDTSMQSGSDGR